MKRTLFVYINDYDGESEDTEKYAIVILTALCMTAENIRLSFY